MRLLNDPSSDTLRFGASPILRRIGSLTALAAVGLAAFLLLFPLQTSLPRNLLLTLAGAAAGCGCLLALWDETLALNVRANSYCHARGVRPFQRRRSGSLDDFTRLILVVRARRAAGDSIERRFILRLENDRRGFDLYRSRNEEDAHDTAHRLAARLRRSPKKTVLAAPKNSAASRWIVTGAAWLGMASVMVIMLWPVLTGSRRQWRSHTRSFSRQNHPYFDAFNRGWAYYQQGQYRQAEQQFRASISFNPAYADAYNMLAYALAEQNELDAALDAARRALEIAPGSGNIEDTVGEMHERRGEWRDAVSYYRKALRDMPSLDNQETHTKLGRTLLALGRQAEAKGHLEWAARYPRTQWGGLARRLLDEMPTSFHQP
jgi:Tfp pilus assembly protein PilF